MKMIAFYLPQFHRIPENDEWWGEGFTEWTNVKKSKPVFRGHYQPRIPLHQNYYNLSDPDVMVWQMDLAKKYGIYGFCFYHYWFAGKKLLEKPVEDMLKNGRANLPFCLSWANEPWTRTWDGKIGSREVLIGQDYGGKADWKEHFEYLLQFFKSPNYIKYHEKPVFLIYRAQNVEGLEEMMDYWQKLAKKSGLQGIAFFQMNTIYGYKKSARGFDGIVDFEPVRTLALSKSFWALKCRFFLSCDFLPAKVKYSDILNEMVKDERLLDSKRFYGMFTGFDNAARKGIKGLLIYKNSPESFGHFLDIQVKRSIAEGKEFLFINAWNEWAEGAYLEPDERYGYGYLEAVKRVSVENNLTDK
ncbi:MAG: glycosyl transferase [Lachnospiraceae bacterium]|nr:glycosyl transferase [Lachnospiraceae bacterium]